MRSTRRAPLAALIVLALGCGSAPRQPEGPPLEITSVDAQGRRWHLKAPPPGERSDSYRWGPAREGVALGVRAQTTRVADGWRYDVSLVGALRNQTQETVRFFPGWSLRVQWDGGEHRDGTEQFGLLRPIEVGPGETCEGSSELLSLLWPDPPWWPVDSRSLRFSVMFDGDEPLRSGFVELVRRPAE